jgi:ABC-type dipeptide/oligopeptide/nickel transport system permease component
MLLLFITLCIPQQVSADPVEIDEETMNRLMVQYGLDKRQEISKIDQFISFWSQGDFGYSLPADGYSFPADDMFDAANLVFYPLPSVCRQLPAIVYLIKMPFILSPDLAAAPAAG